MPPLPHEGQLLRRRPARPVTGRPVVTPRPGRHVACAHVDARARLVPGPEPRRPARLPALVGRRPVDRARTARGRPLGGRRPGAAARPPPTASRSPAGGGGCSPTSSTRVVLSVVGYLLTLPGRSSRSSGETAAYQERMLEADRARRDVLASSDVWAPLFDVYADHLLTPGRRPGRARRRLLRRLPALARRDPRQARCAGSGSDAAPRTAGCPGARSPRRFLVQFGPGYVVLPLGSVATGSLGLFLAGQLLVGLLLRLVDGLTALGPRRPGPDVPRPSRRPRRWSVASLAERGARDQASPEPHDSAGQRLPRASCSRSIASNSALKLPLPKPSEPCRSMNS